jgi:hypothetical protein
MSKPVSWPLPLELSVQERLTESAKLEVAVNPEGALGTVVDAVVVADADVVKDEDTRGVHAATRYSYWVPGESPVSL